MPIQRATLRIAIELLDQQRQGVDFSGVFEGSIVEGGQSGTAAQVKFVRNGHSVQGSYLLGEICGSISGEVTRDRLEFSWKRAGNSGHGIDPRLPTELAEPSAWEKMPRVEEPSF